jgi:methyl-accepting chemotaxis protein
MFLAFIGYSGSKKLAHALDKVAAVQLPALHAMSTLDMIHDGVRATIYEGLYIANNLDPEVRKRVIEDLEEFQKNAEEKIEKLEELNLHVETKEKIKSSLPLLKDYFKVAKNSLDLIFVGNKTQTELALADFLKLFKVLEKDLASLGEVIEKDATEVNNDGQNTPQSILFISFCAIFFGLVVSIWVVITLTKKLTSIYQEISSVAKGVNDTGGELATASQQLSKASQEQASSFEETSSSLEEISAMVASSLKSTGQSVDLTTKVSQLVQVGTDSMAELQEAVNQIAAANSRVEALEKLIKEIGEKTELIDEIVFQTRLLSFNASVEAERAGEYGRGFAVVAQEVGNLAQMSGKSAAEISQIVKNSIKEAQEVVTLNRAKVELGVALCKKTYQQLASIETASKEILGSSQVVLRSSEEQNSGIQQINYAIQAASQSTQENTSLAMQVSGNSTRLADEADKLQVVVGNLGEMVFGGNGARPEPANREREDHYSQERPTAVVKSFNFRKSKDSGKNFNVNVQALRAVENSSEDPWEKL